MNITMINRKCD